MSDHLIRLRAAWELTIVGGRPEEARRIALPASWPPGPDAPFVLSRAFHAPRVEEPRETLRLRIADVPGLTRIRVCGVALPLPTSPVPDECMELDLPRGLPSRCVLELEVDPRAWESEFGGESRPWGDIRLLIRDLEGG